MCLAIPGLVEELFDQDGLSHARVNFGGIRKTVCLEYTPGVKPGDYVLVHVGFAISVIDELEAQRTLEILRANNELAELEAGTPRDVLSRDDRASQAGAADKL